MIQETTRQFSDRGEYEAALTSGLRWTGESRDYFADRRVRWLAARLRQLAFRAESVLDFGCGDGSTTSILHSVLESNTAVGLDVSAEIVELAQRELGSPRMRFATVDGYEACQPVDLCYCNGVFHHIAPEDRPNALGLIHQALRPGGLFAFWENNPFNPATRWVMSRIPFDRDAIMLAAFQARRLLRRHGFEVLDTEFLFLFPRALSRLRAIEPWLSRLPIGAQYQILARKPPNSP